MGTGTSVGKTHVARAILWEAMARGRDAVGLKPVESGMGDRCVGDQTTLSEVLHVKHPLAADLRRPGSGASPTVMFHVKHALYEFAEPISPHLAARRTGVEIDTTRIAAWVAQFGASLTVVETAGGLFTPLGRAIDNHKLACALLCDPLGSTCPYLLLVVPDRLGALHDARSTIGLARACGRAPDGVVLSAPEQADASTGTNEAELRWLGIAAPIVTFPRASPQASTTRAAASLVLAAVDAAASNRDARPAR